MRSRGFTLVETVVALGVAAVLLATVQAAVGRTAAARARAERAAERLAASRTLLAGLGTEIEAALASRGADAPERFVLGAPATDGPPWSTLRFATATARDESRLVAYRVEPEGRERGTLRRAAASRFAPADVPEPPGVALVPGVRRFEVRAFDGETWHAAWSAPALPRAVEIVLGVDDGAGHVEELATTVVPARAGGR